MCGLVLVADSRTWAASWVPPWEVALSWLEVSSRYARRVLVSQERGLLYYSLIPSSLPKRAFRYVPVMYWRKYILQIGFKTKLVGSYSGPVFPYSNLCDLTNDLGGHFVWFSRQTVQFDPFPSDWGRSGKVKRRRACEVEFWVWLPGYFSMTPVFFTSRPMVIKTSICVENIQCGSYVPLAYSSNSHVE